MHKLGAWLLAVAACDNGYYIANVYQDGSGNLSVQKCALSASDKPEPDDCFVEPVGPPPASDRTSPTPPAKPAAIGDAVAAKNLLRLVAP